MIPKILLSSVALACAQPAVAATWTFSLSVADPSAGLGTGPFGTITVTENAGKLDFVETLASGYHINQGNGSNHFAFFFSLANDPSVTVTNLSSASLTPQNLTSGSNVSAPPFGSFQTDIACTGCGNGYAGGLAGPISFTVGVTGQTLTLASLLSNTYNGQQIYFASDLVSSSGRTGNVGATLNATVVPEPASWGMMLIGFGGLGYAMRRRSKAATRIRFA